MFSLNNRVQPNHTIAGLFTMLLAHANANLKYRYLKFYIVGVYCYTKYWLVEM